MKMVTFGIVGTIHAITSGMQLPVYFKNPVLP